MPSSLVYLEDCIEGMKRYADNHFDLAIVDPPYGINMDGGHIGGSVLAKTTAYTKKDWDKEAPNKEYFKELFRVSKNQIVWGANHFISRMPYDSSCWLVWNKLNGYNNFADCELAWASFKTSVRKFDFRWAGMLQQNMKDKEIRIHPTQKPVALYEWILANYAKPNDLILDTHLGSGSSRIAAYKGGFNFVGFEIDQEYFNAQDKRFNDFKLQLKLF
jgi:site-specific DNA-methyltransferase (adenine-specific)